MAIFNYILYGRVDRLVLVLKISFSLPFVFMIPKLKCVGAPARHGFLKRLQPALNMSVNSNTKYVPCILRKARKSFIYLGLS
jgi:hypothetical protein